MFCRFCGKNIEGDSLFCPYCGKSLKSMSKGLVESVPQSTVISQVTNIDDNTYSQTSKIVGNTLRSATEIICYVTLAVFLILNIKMAPSFGITKTIIYVVTAAVAIGLIELFNYKVLLGGSKTQYTIALLIALIVLIASVGLRIVYELKVDSIVANFPSSGNVKVVMTTHTDYYNATGTGTIKNPITDIRLNDEWYDSGSVIEVTLGQKYSLRVFAGGSRNYGSKDTNIVFNEDSFISGRYEVTEEVLIPSGPASMAKVQLTFKRYCAFWEVIFG